MNKVMKALGGALIAAVVVVGASSVLYPPLFGTVIGFAQVHWWEWVHHGKASLECGGSQRMTIRGQHLELKPGEIQSPFDDGLITAGGNCHLELIDCEIKAPKVIDAGGNAHVIIRGGHITGTEKAIDAGGNAVVEVHGAKIDGKVTSGGSAKLVGISPGSHGKVTDTAPPKQWNQLACKGIADCFSQANFSGNVNVRVTATVASSGTVTGASVSGEVPAAVRDCIVKNARTKRLGSYHGGPGKLLCTLTGTINGGTQTISTSSTFSH